MNAAGPARRPAERRQHARAGDPGARAAAQQQRKPLRYGILGAFVIIAWVGVKLLIDYLHSVGYIHFEVNKWFSSGLIIAIFGIAYFYARSQGPVEEQAEDAAAALLQEQEQGRM